MGKKKMVLVYNRKFGNVIIHNDYIDKYIHYNNKSFDITRNINRKYYGIRIVKLY